MSERPSPAAVASEMLELLHVKGLVPSAHHAAIDAQIAVLEMRYSLDDTYDIFGDDEAEGFSQHVLDRALAARNWMAGAEGHVRPSDGWANFEVEP